MIVDGYGALLRMKIIGTGNELAGFALGKVKDYSGGVKIGEGIRENNPWDNHYWAVDGEAQEQTKKHAGHCEVKPTRRRVALMEQGYGGSGNCRY
jgi:hypothetical protein